MKKLWSASKSEIKNSNLANYENYINLKYNQKFNRKYKLPFVTGKLAITKNNVIYSLYNQNKIKLN